MADIRSEQRKVAAERRMDARLALQFDAKVLGISGIPKITNISAGGFFLKGDISDRIEIGQIRAINVKLPSEMNVTRFKARVMRKNYQGIGCQFAFQNERERATISKFFKFYNFYNDINFKSFD